MTEKIALTVPDEFCAFPYSRPYLIQTDLMRHVYMAIENRKLAIVESPTGTGKTLSLLTGTLTWLRHDKHRSKLATLESLRNSLQSSDDPEWVAIQSLGRLREEIEAEERAFEEHLATLRSKEEASRRERARVTKRPRFTSPEGREGLESDDDSLLPGFEGKDVQGDAMPFSINNGTARLQPSSASISRTKIYFASRTHSQLSQVVHELLKLKPVYSVPNDGKDDQKILNNVEGSSSHLPRTVSLASRSHLCINDRLRSQTTDLDEGCRELLTERRSERCPYLPALDEAYRLDEFRDRILASPKDVEDLVLTGKDMKLCPYFSSRAALSSAEVVTLPYNLLLHRGSRDALGIDLQDQVVIIDEAHNLADTLLQLHTVELSTSMLHLAIRQLTEYLTRFRTRLNAVHTVHLRRLGLFLQALSQFANSHPTGIFEGHDSVMSVSAFVESMGNKVNGINFLELQSYLATTKVARKVDRHSEKMQNNDIGRTGSIGSKQDSSTVRLATGKGSSRLVPPLHIVEAFISKLTNDVEDGIITITGNKLVPSEKLIRYQHLNPATYFEDITRSARCVILAGGTMSPISDMTLQLFPTVPHELLSVFSCGHVIPQLNLQCLVVGRGPRGKDLEFKFKSRDDQSLIDELGQSLFNVASVCPNGVVVFYPSYAFLDKVKRDWSMNGLLDRIQRKKQIFYEPHESAEVDDVLNKYAHACTQIDGPSKGALLFAVVGAKLSEGLNFADELARAVVLVGIPYPNLASPELRERMKYVSRRKQNTTEKAIDPGEELYENLAMRAVNQSIGRAIRHQNDWAALILLDKRYGSQKVQLKLPGWIRQSIVAPPGFGQAMKLLGEFYRSKRS